MQWERVKGRSSVALLEQKKSKTFGKLLGFFKALSPWDSNFSGTSVPLYVGYEPVVFADFTVKNLAGNGRCRIDVKTGL